MIVCVYQRRFNTGHQTEHTHVNYLQDDEDFLVDNEEEMDIKDEIDIKQDSRKEYLGKFQYKVTHLLLSSLH